ncbi:hypothetical protein L3Q72_15985 [Vibrio sp. JC009]|uniref:hypothetical protein n=1 Tax=Vibrio sp. JC009 TaxID=2912314 RepID=UPI0023AF9D31|nr:hypothetical protein [Vibrio sp. JC009]WED24376.1 hypothetical protein L3Q72_15985 [Vibrio sp. JC009]
MLGVKRMSELQKAKKRFDDACSRHHEMVALRDAGKISDETLLDAIDDMFQAKIELEEIYLDR